MEMVSKAGATVTRSLSPPPSFKKSCVAEPLFTGALEKLTMEAVALHVHLGMVNLLTDELEKLWPKIVVWFEKLALNREPYHGRHFEV